MQHAPHRHNSARATLSLVMCSHWTQAAQRIQVMLAEKQPLGRCAVAGEFHEHSAVPSYRLHKHASCDGQAGRQACMRSAGTQHSPQWVAHLLG